MSNYLITNALDYVKDYQNYIDLNVQCQNNNTEWRLFFRYSIGSCKNELVMNTIGEIPSNSANYLN